MALQKSAFIVHPLFARVFTRSEVANAHRVGIGFRDHSENSSLGLGWRFFCESEFTPSIFKQRSHSRSFVGDFAARFSMVRSSQRFPNMRFSERFLEVERHLEIGIAARAATKQTLLARHGSWSSRCDKKG